MARDHNREIGVCPHCLAWQIEFLWDYAETSYNRWLCRACKRLFPTPRIVMFIVTADMTNYVPASQVLWLERATLPETLRTGRIRRKPSTKSQTKIFFRKWPPELAIACLVVTLILGFFITWHRIAAMSDSTPERTGEEIQSVTSPPTETTTRTDREHKSSTKSSQTEKTTTGPSKRHYASKLYMVELINEERQNVGVPPVVLGTNNAAQIHAETSLKNCTSSHWGVDGLKPYMRYSLAGGYQSNSENVSGTNYCIDNSDWILPLSEFQEEAREVMKGFMGSPGHRDNILDKWHKKVNIGVWWDKFNMTVVQHFEGDYVKYDRLPSVENGVLTMSGRTKNGAGFDAENDFGVQLFYDQPHHALTRGQVSRTYCYDGGLPVAAFRPQLTGLWYWTEDEIADSLESCPDPYAVDPGAVAPASPDEAHEFWQRAYDASEAAVSKPITVPWITALKWTANNEDFAVSVDLTDVLNVHGDGVYTVTIWDKIGREDVVISQYSIFRGITPPATYGQDTR